MTQIAIIFVLVLQHGSAFWDLGTTTTKGIRTDTLPRQSFFRWQSVEFEWFRFWTPYWDWVDIDYRRKLNVMAGISIDFLPLGTAVILNRRALISSANFMEPYMNRILDLRIWALGRQGAFNTPYRYRVWRVRRLYPRSNNPEHWHGPRGVHVPRHDVTIIHSWDQMYVYDSIPNRYHYAWRAFIPGKHQTLKEPLHFAGSGYEYMQHVYENYKIFYNPQHLTDIVNCENYLPKWWGKFICFRNTGFVYDRLKSAFAGVPNGGGFFSVGYVVGIGCFEIRYDQDRIMVFSDLRYYSDQIYVIANYTAGEYYEYAYPQWSVLLFWIYDGHGNSPYIPAWQVRDDMYPLGRK